MESENIIMQFISIWNWFILGWISFISAFIFILIGGNYGFVFFVTFMIAAFVCWILSSMRRFRLYKDE